MDPVFRHISRGHGEVLGGEDGRDGVQGDVGRDIRGGQGVFPGVLDGRQSGVDLGQRVFQGGGIDGDLRGAVRQFQDAAGLDGAEDCLGASELHDARIQLRQRIGQKGDALLRLCKTVLHLLDRFGKGLPGQTDGGEDRVDGGESRADGDELNVDGGGLHGQVVTADAQLGQFRVQLSEGRLGVAVLLRLQDAVDGVQIAGVRRGADRETGPPQGGALAGLYGSLGGSRVGDGSLLCGLRLGRGIGLRGNGYDLLRGRDCVRRRGGVFLLRGNDLLRGHRRGLRGHRRDLRRNGRGLRRNGRDLCRNGRDLRRDRRDLRRYGRDLRRYGRDLRGHGRDLRRNGRDLRRDRRDDRRHGDARRGDHRRGGRDIGKGGDAVVQLLQRVLRRLQTVDQILVYGGFFGQLRLAVLQLLDALQDGADDGQRRFQLGARLREGQQLLLQILPCRQGGYRLLIEGGLP